jgi:hypothetical protein
MSWNIAIIGYPSHLVAALHKESERLTGNSKLEFDAALPNMVNLINLNYNNQAEGQVPVLRLVAHGHAYANETGPVYGNVSVTLAAIDGALV